MHTSGSALFHTFRGYGCPAGTYNDMAVLVFNPQVSFAPGQPANMPMLNM
jgi:hypothetical protein